MIWDKWKKIFFFNRFIIGVIKKTALWVIFQINFKEKMERGVQIDSDMTAKCKVAIIGPNKFKVILTEGKKHQIRRMCVALFQEVEDLKRIRIMNIKLGDIKEGAYRTLAGDELQTFLKSLELI